MHLEVAFAGAHARSVANDGQRWTAKTALISTFAVVVRSAR
jgi:hypothetical protein